MVKHHPDVDLLTAFSAGTLKLSHALCIATHIENCTQCQKELQKLQALGGSLLDELSPTVVPEDLKQSVMALLDQEENSPAEIASPQIRINSPIPKALHQFIATESYDDLDWRKLTPSIEVIEICTDGQSKVELIRIQPGGRVATHTHTGDEFTVVLDGSFSDEMGLYSDGDFMVRDASHKHRPVATKDKACICLAVTDAPIEFTGLFTQLLNPFIRRSFKSQS